MRFNYTWLNCLPLATPRVACTRLRTNDSKIHDLIKLKHSASISKKCFWNSGTVFALVRNKWNDTSEPKWRLADLWQNSSICQFDSQFKGHLKYVASSVKLLLSFVAISFRNSSTFCGVVWWRHYQTVIISQHLNIAWPSSEANIPNVFFVSPIARKRILILLNVWEVFNL